MSAPTNHWKLGLFVVVCLLLAFCGIMYFGARTIPKETVTYASYFDESVTGLEVGSPVKYRGVTIGDVSHIDIAPDHRHVKVSYELTVSVLQQLGIAHAHGEKTRLPISPNLRAQLSTTGVTGVKFLQLDYFDDPQPIQPLPFAVAGNYIPSTPSSLKNIESSVVNTADRLPEVTERVIALLDRINHIVDQVQDEKLPERTGALVAHLDRTLTTLDTKLEALDARGLSADARATLSTWNGTAQRANQLLDRVDGQHGLLTSAQQVSDSLADAARNANGAGVQFEQTLRDVSDAADSIKDLADALSRQPDMLLKGRAER